MTNKELVEKYPFLSWYGNPLLRGYSENKTNYNYTWEDEIPEGWRKAFCPQMWDELKVILEKADYVDKLSHSFGDISYYWSDDNLKVTAIKTCLECKEEIKEVERDAQILFTAISTDTLLEG